MEVKLPARYEDLRLRHLMVLQSVQDPIERIAQITGRPSTDILSIPMAVIDRASQHLDLLMGTETPLHPKTVSMDGIEMGFIPDWSQFTTGEWIDMERYTQDVWSNAHRIMALLYRPITNQVGDRYEIEKYTSKEEADRWLDSPAQWFAGALLFFSSSRARLVNTTRQSLEEATEHLIGSLTSGDGMTSSTPLRVTTYSKWMQSLKHPSKYFSSTSHTSKTFTT